MTKSNKRFTAMLSVLAFQSSLPMWLEKSTERVAVAASCTVIIALITLLHIILGED